MKLLNLIIISIILINLVGAMDPIAINSRERIILQDNTNSIINQLPEKTTSSQINRNQKERIIQRSNNIVIKKEDQEFFQKQLQLDKPLRTEVARKFVEKKQNNQLHTQRIIRFAKLAELDKRENVSLELLDIREEFIEKLERYHDSNNINKEKVRKQIQRYSQRLDKKEKPRLNISNDRFRQFFKDKNADNLIQSLLTQDSV